MNVGQDSFDEDGKGNPTLFLSRSHLPSAEEVRPDLISRSTSRSADRCGLPQLPSSIDNALEDSR